MARNADICAVTRGDPQEETLERPPIISVDDLLDLTWHYECVVSPKLLLHMLHTDQAKSSPSPSPASPPLHQTSNLSTDKESLASSSEPLPISSMFSTHQYVSLASFINNNPSCSSSDLNSGSYIISKPKPSNYEKCNNNRASNPLKKLNLGDRFARLVDHCRTAVAD